MTPTRRDLLTSGLAATTLAGCVGLPGDDDTPTGGAPGDAGDTPEGSLTLAMGEGAVFTDDESVELAVTVGEPRLRETVAAVRDGDIYVDSPGTAPRFLFADIALENRGSSTIDPPRGLSLDADGERVDREAIRVPGQRYRDVGELAPGETASATVAFPFPEGVDSAAVELRFTALLDSPPARWQLDTESLSTVDTVPLDRSGLGDTITVSAGEYAYAFTPTAARLVDGYGADDGSRHEPATGDRFLLVDARAESVGERAVKLPTPYEVRAAAGDADADGTRYRVADERYPGRVDLTPPGEQIAGTLLFEVPADAPSHTLRLAVGNETFATWPLSPATPTPSE